MCIGLLTLHQYLFTRQKNRIQRHISGSGWESVKFIALSRLF